MAEIYIPHDILIKILIYLPPKALIKFLTVSKSFYTLITNPNFIYSHFHHHQSHNLFFVLQSEFRHSIQRFNPTRHRNLLLSPSTTVGQPFSSVAGSCNGVVCLFSHYHQTICLWNPLINRYINVDCPIPIKSSDFRLFGLGFGFNSITHDFKIVAIACSDSFDSEHDPVNSDFHNVVHVYSINSGIWKVMDFPESLCKDMNYLSEGVFVNGCIHWILYHGRVVPGPDPDNYDVVLEEYEASILTFDLGNDVFGEIELPPELGSTIDPDMCLAVLDNSLVVIEFSGGISGCRVWKMKDCGLKDSWEVCFRIKVPELSQISMGFVDKIEDKDVIVTSSGSLLSFDVRTDNSTVVNGEILQLGGQVFGYTKSLALLDQFRNDYEAQSVVIWNGINS